MAQKDTDVLAGCDQVVLDLLAPEAAPARVFEVVIIGRVGEAAFHEVATPAPIGLGGSAVRLGTP